MKLEKRVQIVLPVRVHIRTKEGKPLVQMVCTYDISRKGARLVGVQGVTESGEMVTLERNKERALYRVMWVGKAGTPQAGQMGVQCVEPEKLIWEVNLDDLEEQYETIEEALAEKIKTGKSYDPVQPKLTHAQIFSDDHADILAGEVVKISPRSCTVKTDHKLRPGTQVQLLITNDILDLRLKGAAQRSEGPALSLELTEVRKGDRRRFIYLLENP